MANTPEQSKHSGNYVINPESGTEMARLMYQDRLVTKQLGGLFPSGIDLTSVSDILDIACGPGGWALDLARLYPTINVKAFDCSHIMIDYAQAQARTQKLNNLQFQHADATKHLDYPDNSFDIVNARYIMSFMPKSGWPELMQECKRILRPGGFLSLTESEAIMSNSAAAEKLVELMCNAGKLSDRLFSPSGRNFGILQMLNHFLKQAGYENIQRKANAIDISSGAEAHENNYQNFFVAIKLLQPFIINFTHISNEEFEQLHQQAIAEMMLDDFCGIWFHLTVWGSKPVV